MDLPRISSDLAVMGGKACIKGTRITVDVILDHLASGEAMNRVLAGYPPLTQKDIDARPALCGRSH